MPVTQFPATIDKAKALARYWVRDQEMSVARIAALCAAPMRLRQCGEGYHVAENSNMAFPKLAGKPPRLIEPQMLATVVLLACAYEKMGPQEVLDTLGRSGYDCGLVNVVHEVLCPQGEFAFVLGRIMHPPTATFVRGVWLRWMIDHGADAAEQAMKEAMLATIKADTEARHSAVMRAKEYSGLTFRKTTATELPVVESMQGTGVVCGRVDHALLVLHLHTHRPDMVPEIQACLDKGVSRRLLWTAYEDVCMA